MDGDGWRYVRGKNSKPMALICSRCYIRLISVLVIVSFLGLDIAQATPIKGARASLQPISLAQVIQSPSSLNIPFDYVTLKEVYKGSNNKLIIHIQDPHSNYSGQMNIAKTLDSLMRSTKEYLILAEGSSIDATLTDHKAGISENDWKISARRFLQDGVITGIEYLNLTTSHPLKIMGIEDKYLYQQALVAYGDLVSVRKEILLYLHKIHSSIDRLKNKHYPALILNYEDQLRQSSESTQDLTLKVSTLMNLSKNTSIDLSIFHEVQQLSLLNEKEKSIQFDAANKEQEGLLTHLRQKGFSQEVASFLEQTKHTKYQHLSQGSLLNKLFNLALVNNIHLDTYQELKHYQSYLEEFSKLDIESLLKEIDYLEDLVYKALLPAQEQKNLRAIDRFVGILGKAYSIKMSSFDFKMLMKNKGDFNTQSWEAFLNDELIKLEYFEDLIPYKTLFEEASEPLLRFYRIVDQRDLAFLENTNKAMARDNAKIGYLIAGGYHTENLTNLLKEEGYSIAVLTPQVEYETETSLYEKILLMPLQIAKKRALINQHEVAKQSHDEFSRTLLQYLTQTVQPNGVGVIEDRMGQYRGGRHQATSEALVHAARMANSKDGRVRHVLTIEELLHELISLNIQDETLLAHIARLREWIEQNKSESMKIEFIDANPIFAAYKSTVHTTVKFHSSNKKYLLEVLNERLPSLIKRLEFAEQDYLQPLYISGTNIRLVQLNSHDVVSGLELSKVEEALQLIRHAESKQSEASFFEGPTKYIQITNENRKRMLLGHAQIPNVTMLWILDEDTPGQIAGTMVHEGEHHLFHPRYQSEDLILEYSEIMREGLQKEGCLPDEYIFRMLDEARAYLKETNFYLDLALYYLSEERDSGKAREALKSGRVSMNQAGNEYLYRMDSWEGEFTLTNEGEKLYQITHEMLDLAEAREYAIEDRVKKTEKTRELLRKMLGAFDEEEAAESGEGARLASPSVPYSIRDIYRQRLPVQTNRLAVGDAVYRVSGTPYDHYSTLAQFKNQRSPSGAYITESPIEEIIDLKAEIDSLINDVAFNKVHRLTIALLPSIHRNNKGKINDAGGTLNKIFEARGKGKIHIEYKLISTLDEALALKEQSDALNQISKDRESNKIILLGSLSDKSSIEKILADEAYHGIGMAIMENKELLRSVTLSQVLNQVLHENREEITEDGVTALDRKLYEGGGFLLKQEQYGLTENYMLVFNYPANVANSAYFDQVLFSALQAGRMA